MRQIGLHLRVKTNLVDLAKSAIDLGLKIFQCFFVQQQTGLYLEPSHEEIKQFRAIRDKHFDTLYAHAAYWINLASANFNNTLYLLRQELALAGQLGFNALVVHPGSWTSQPSKAEGLQAIARVLNAVLEREDSMPIILENLAFGQKTIGSDFDDFKQLRAKFDKPEKIKFCVDTAHAFAYGYDIKTESEQREFIDMLSNAVGLDSIHLLHVNDTQEQLGSKKDKHDILGEGSIGVAPLKLFINQPEMRDIPCILELPDVAVDVQRRCLKIIKE
jgi:deoxyribonuclease-4